MKGIQVVGIALGLSMSAAATAEGFYVGAGAGLTDASVSEGGLRFSDTAVGWRILAGYEVTENFAFEAGYSESGTLSDTVAGFEVETDLEILTFSLVGLAPISDRFSLLGKLGYYDGEEETRAVGETFTGDTDGLTLGAGFRYDFEQSALRLEYEWFDTEEGSVKALGLTGIFRF